MLTLGKIIEEELNCLRLQCFGTLYQVGVSHHALTTGRAKTYVNKKLDFNDCSSSKTNKLIKETKKERIH